MIRPASPPLSWLASLALLALLASPGCERDDGVAGDPAGGAAGASPETVGAALPAGEGAAGSDTADPDPSGPGTEPPTQPDSAMTPSEQDPGDDGDAMTEPPPTSDPGPAAGDPSTPEPGGTGALDGGGSCDLSKTRLYLEDRPLQEGDLCDDVVVCAADAASEEALVGVAPEFDCDGGENVLGLCAGDQVPCVWRPGVLDAAEMDSVCAATAALAEGGELVCVVYL